MLAWSSREASAPRSSRPSITLQRRLCALALGALCTHSSLVCSELHLLQHPQ